MTLVFVVQPVAHPHAPHGAPDDPVESEASNHELRTFFCEQKQYDGGALVELVLGPTQALGGGFHFQGRRRARVEQMFGVAPPVAGQCGCPVRARDGEKKTLGFEQQRTVVHECGWLASFQENVTCSDRRW